VPLSEEGKDTSADTRRRAKAAGSRAQGHEPGPGHALQSQSFKEAVDTRGASVGTSLGRSAMSGVGVGVDRDRRTDGRAGGRPRKERRGRVRKRGLGAQTWAIPLGARSINGTRAGA
jgi:hypothetical protein